LTFCHQLISLKTSTRLELTTQEERTMPSREFDYDAVRDSIRHVLNQPGYDNYDEDVKHTAGPILVRLAWHAAGTYGQFKPYWRVLYHDSRNHHPMMYGSYCQKKKKKKIRKLIREAQMELE
jgi:hypothetical protein